jgi:hypothetical protein
MFAKLGKLARHIGSKVVHATEGALNRLNHIGRKVHEHIGKIPVVGGALQSGLEAAYNMPIPVIGKSAKDIYERVHRTVGVGKSLTSDDPNVRREGYHKILNGDIGTAAQRGAQAVQRIADAIT